MTRLANADLARGGVDPRWINVKGVRRWNGEPFPEPSENTLRNIAAAYRPSKRPRGNACEEATGTYAGFMRHRRALEDACEPCQQACRQYTIDSTKRRVDNGVKPCPGCGDQIHYRSKTCRKCFQSTKIRPCGTRAAYRRHLRNKEVPCDPCRAAETYYQRTGQQLELPPEPARELSGIAGTIRTAPESAPTQIQGLTHTNRSDRSEGSMESIYSPTRDAISSEVA